MRKILIANRGEIACRVIRTARALGYRTVAVYSEADAHALHVKLADEAVLIGPSAVGESYLKIEAILHAAKAAGADAVHPGYGFLSENSDFAKACDDIGLTFIGPPVDAIKLMGSKRLSKVAMQNAGVPCIPGYDGPDQSNETLLSEAEKIGFPLMIKASAGGGGRGMRLVKSASEVEAALSAARSEALNAFGSDELILEKALTDVRHVEVQVFADSHGDTVHLFERDCSVQRRHQKVVEEAPSPSVDQALRESMGKSAVDVAKACSYRGAGTVEFLLDRNGQFYFLEMNTRLQVEHPVTELITGLDLVEWQILVADGQPLPLKQEEICLSGHAVEVRLYAEDPKHQFMPQTGTIEAWAVPDRAGIRVDEGVQVGDTVSAFYDPMLAKVIASGRSREEALRRLSSGLQDLRFLGVNNNKHFLNAIIDHPVFIDGQATTGFIDDHLSDHASLNPDTLSAEDVAIASLLFLRPEQGAVPTVGGTTIVMQKLRFGEHSLDVSAAIDGRQYLISSDVGSAEMELLEVNEDSLLVLFGGVRKHIAGIRRDDRAFFEGSSGHMVCTNATYAPAQRGGGAGDGAIKAPMDGSVISVSVRDGESVTVGQALIVMEAMKMEHTLTAPHAGTVTGVTAAAGDQVKMRSILCIVEPEG